MFASRDSVEAGLILYASKLKAVEGGIALFAPTAHLNKKPT